MTSDPRWAHIERIFDEVADLPPAERRERVERACRGDPDLQADVERLLAADERDAGPLDAPPPALQSDLFRRGTDGDPGADCS
ncbi:MAG: hypothetical protein R3E10_12545 [Gemmatimonadota bacterium]